MIAAPKLWTINMTYSNNASKDAVNYLVKTMGKDSTFIVDFMKTIIMNEDNDSEILKQYKLTVPLCNEDSHFLLSAAVNHIDRSPESESDSNAKYALSLLEECSKRKHDPEGTSLYTAKAYFTLGDYKSCFIHLNKYCKLTKNSDDEASLIVLAISKSEIPQVEKYVSALRTKGYSIFIKEIDEKEKRRLVHGVLFDGK